MLESRNPSTAKSTLGHTWEAKYDPIKAEKFLPYTRRILQSMTRIPHHQSYTPRPGDTEPVIEVVQSTTPARALSTSRETHLP